MTVYSSEGCQYCVKLKQLLRENNITYINKDMNDEHVLKEFKQYEISAIPFTLLSLIKKKRELLVISQKI
ncbi:glutaredoxin family protein [Lysinibacillus xylanilyticus]|uniref:glutaredoxin family protein n=1 Tax=Lysinibacillus xylanilyticus TaxID=582475 RepID=UPI0036DEEECD